MIKRFYILLLAIVASVGMSFAQDPGIVNSGTKGGMSYTFYDNGLLEISGSGALPGSAFTNWDGGFGTSVKNIRFAEDCEVYGLDYMWFACYTENSQLETVEINSVAPIMFSGTSGAGIFYRQDGAVTLTITAPGIVDVEGEIIDNYGSPVNMIFNMPATTVFEKKWFSGLTNNFAVTIPTGATGHIPAGYVFKDSYDQEEYDHLVADGYEDMFWDTHSDLVEGVDYTLGVESTFVITAENASQIFGKATVSFQAPTEASNSEWVLWRKSDLKTFSDMSSGDQKVCKDVTVKVNNGVYNTNSGWGIHFESSGEDGVQFVAPEGKVFKRIVILNEYGTFSDPNWSYDKNYKRWSGSADTVGFVGNICGISLIEFEVEASAPANTPADVMALINAIGTVELTAECKAKIDAARTAYDALSDGDKALVANIATLTQAETDYAALAAAAAAPVIAQIEALPTAIKLSTYFSTYDLMVAARAAYNALSAEAQAAVTNLSKLTNLEAAFAAIGGVNEKLSKPFSVGEGQVVYFSHGNLQAIYNGSNWSWALAAHQYDYIGDTSGNIIINGNGTLSGAGTVDLFGWVANSSTVLTSGVAKYGVSNSDNVGDYGLGTTETLKGDWGVAANDANIGGYNDWRILSNDEWVYLFKTRTDAASKYGYATVGGVNGVIIIPDAFTDPMKNKGNLAFRPQNVDKGYSTNVYATGGDWEAMEAAGAVFMPAAGRRYGTTMTVNEGTGFYWSSTPMSYQASYFMGFMGSNVVPNNDRYRSHGLSVRLVSNNAPVASTPLDSALVVKDLIEAIPQPVVYTPECSAAIKAAREALDALGANASLLDEADLQKLTDAEAAYAQLLAQAVKAVKDQIDALPATPLTDATKKLSEYNKVLAARKAYDALSDEEKAAVTNYDKLTAVEAAFAAIGGGGGSAPDGAVNSKFSIDESSVVYFSKGNLQATTTDLGANWTWGFAANQWDLIGDAAANNAISGNGTVSANGTVDLFGWSTSSTKYGIHNGTNGNISDYAGDFVDWGTTIGDGWFTLSKEQWHCLLNTRTGDKAATVNSVADCRYTKATINTDGTAVMGIILFPDGGTFAESEFTAVGSPNAEDANYTTTCTTAQWNALQAKGCVFLPAAGRRYGKDVSTEDPKGYYWSSSPKPSTDDAYFVFFYSYGMFANNDFRCMGLSVRLVTEAPASPLDSAQVVKDLIEAIPQPVVYTPECKEAIKAAREALDALGDEAKALFNEADTAALPAAEATYAELLAQKVAPVIAAINAVPATPLTDATAKLSEYNKVKAAREAYDALSNEEKAAVDNYDKLEAAEAAFAAISGGAPAGALNGKFTINAGGDQIAFAKGNLQATTIDLGEHWTWGFAAHQYDFVGDAAANNAINGDKSVSANGSVDIFGWSTEATYYGIHNSEDNATYSGDFKDWGSNIGEGWRTLTQDEWIYLLKTRTDASSKFGMATVADVHGMIVLPDDYAGAAINSARDAWDNNIISASDWAAYEAAGVVFLPAGGNREGKYVYLVGSNGHYWSSTNYGEEEANSIYFGSDFYKANGIFSRKYSHSVRLVTSNEGISPIAAAQAAVALINAIPQPVVYTPECGAAIKAAREALDALGANASLLDDADLQKLTDAEAAYAQLLAKAVKAVKDQIDALPATPLTDATKKLSEYNKVKAAREAYNALSDEEKAAVDNYDKLTAAEAAFAAIPSVGSETVITWDKNTGIEKMSGTTTSPAYEGITISIKGGGFGPQDDMLRFNIAGLGLSFEFANTLGGNFQKIAISSTNAMPSTPLAGMGEGWAASSGDKIATWTGDAATVKIWDGLTATSYWDVNTIQFTLGATVSATEAAQAAVDKINAIPSPVVLSDECNAAIKAAREAVTALGENASLIDDADLQKLTDAEAALTALNQEVADEVIAKINNIPLQVELKLATRDSIQNARTAYDALTADQQALVTNYQTLLDAEAALAALNPGVPPATPLDSAQAVKDLIDAIPDSIVYPTSGPAIAAALVAYNQLSDAAKGALDDADVQKMTDAATQYAALDAIAAIEAIPAEIVYDPAVKAAIETAREKYDALIDASKALVSEEVLHKLTNAEQAWAILVAKIEHNVSYIGKDGELKHETVALLHIPDPAPDFNGYEFVRWDVKAGDFLEEGLRVKAVYTPIITTNPVAYDSLMYNATAQTLITAGVAKEGHIEYRINDGEWSTELPKATFAAAYVVYYKLVREGHPDYIADSIVSIIAKAPVTYTAPTAVDSLVYNAANQTLIAAGQTSDGTFEYSLNPTLMDSWKTDLPQAMSAGTHNVYYRVKGDLNHKDSTAVDPIAVTIAKAELTATADDKNVIYGDAVPAYTVTYAGWQGDDDTTALAGQIAYTCTYAPTSNVGEYPITPSGVSAANYDITFVNGKVTVAKALLTVTAENKTVTYGDSIPTYTATYSGFKNGDDASVVDSLAYTCAYAPTSNVGDYTITPHSATALNYTFAYVDGKVTVNKAALMITAEDKNVIYGDTVPTYTATYSGWKNGDDASVVTGLVYTCAYAPTSNVGEYTITPSDATATNYAISYTNGKVTVAKAALMITADDKNVIYGDAVPTYTATYSGWKNTDTESVVTGLAYTCEYAPTSNVGEYTITPNSATATNYAISYTNGKVTVAQATLTVTAENKTVTYGDAAPAFTATYSGFKNGDDASVVDSLAYTCEYVVTSNVGNYPIAPNSAKALNYTFVYVNGTLTVNQAALMITAEDKNVIYGDTVPTYTATYSGWKNSDTESVVTGLVYTCEYAPTSNVGEYTITPSDATATNYAISYTNGKVTVAKAALMITAEDKNVIYGDAVPEYTATYSGWKNSDTESVVTGLAYTCEYAPTSNVGEYTITPNSATATNYAISYTNGKVTVAKAALTITANDTTMIYGDEHPEFTASYSGWKNADTESVVTGLAYTTPYKPGSPIGTYTINPNSATAQNYAITFVDGTLTVNKAVVSVSGAEAQIAKFADGHAGAVVLNPGKLNGVKLQDAVGHVTTASFSSADVAEHLTITLFYELTGNASLLNNYDLQPTSEIFSTEGVIIEPFIPDDKHDPVDPESKVEEGIEVYAYGYCKGDSVGMQYHLNAGNPDQYKIEFADPRFTNVDWTALEITGKDGVIYIDVPVDVPTGDYEMTVYFRDSRFTWLESQALTVTFHVNLPETYVRPLFDNTIVLVDTCNCFTDIQWYYREDASQPWEPIPGATGHYYHADSKLDGEFFVQAKMNGVPTYTCGQDDMETLYGEGKLKTPVVKAFPNPVVSTTTVTIENSEQFEHTLRIVNFMGAEVEKTTFTGNETNVEMGGYTQGNYMISVDGIVVKVMKK